MSLQLSRIERPPPKRQAGGSNPLSDAINNAESLDFTRFSALFFACLCFRIDDELRLFFAHVFRVHITITLNQLANIISRNFRFLLIKIAFLLIAQKIVLKILLIEKSAHNSSNLFYPVPFYPFFILCQGFPATHIFQNDRIII